MQKILFTGGVVFSLLLSSFAQRVEQTTAPAEVILQFGTEGHGRRFHLGELIPVQFSYSARTPGLYVWVGNSTRLAGGHSLEISCPPAVERVNRYAPLIRPVPQYRQVLVQVGFSSAIAAGRTVQRVS